MDVAAPFVEHVVKASRPTEVRLERPALIQALAGAMRLEAQGRRWSLLPGQGALVAAGHPIVVTVPIRVRAFWIHFDPSVRPLRQGPLVVFELNDLAREMIQALRLGDPPLDEGARARLLQSLGDVAVALSAQPSPVVLPVPESPALRRAMTLADAQLETLPAFGEIAREVGQSTRSLTRHCTEEIGLSWRDLIRRMRMVRAVEALATSTAPVAEIAVLVGYSALSGFNDAFREVIGQSPSEFRAGLRDGA